MGVHKRVAVKVKDKNNTGFKWSSTKRSPLEAQSETIDFNRKPGSPSILVQMIFGDLEFVIHLFQTGIYHDLEKPVIKRNI